ncbi:adrenodoxin-like protein 1, mitochondrial [Cocos nucifera]|uniref:Adrenodoxin-like protein 1, mitochondrial n=1 Tax=Cocos nucifera TaxID=13894 RepID=A0A8K0IIJ9_COCNU|nr:adrenodoxin-like protein 1, mitochondrial [Cocos nucifera]
MSFLLSRPFASEESLIMVLPRFSQLGARFLKESGIVSFIGMVRYMYLEVEMVSYTDMTLWITVTFVDKDGEERVIQVPIGISMLEAAHENDIELEEDPADEENDMLDLAFGLTETSRLGCQVIAKPELDGMRLALPAATRNFAVDGFVPKPH